MSVQDDIAISHMADVLEGKATPTAPSAEPVAPVQPPLDSTPPPVTPAVPATTPVTPPSIPTTPPNTPPAQPSAFDINAEFEKISKGAIKSTADFEAILEKANKVSGFESEKTNFEKTIADLKAKAEADPFANDYTKRLNELYKSGANQSQIQAFNQLNNVELETLSPADAKILALQMQHKLTPDEARNYVNSTYKLNPDEYDEATIAAETIRLKVDAMSDRAFLQTHKAEVSTPPVDNTAKLQQEQQQKSAEHISKLTPIAASVLDSVNFKGLSLNGKDGDANIVADFDVSDESKAVLKDKINEFIARDGDRIPADESGKEIIQNFAKNMLVIQNYENWIVNAASKREQQVRAEYHNPTPLNRGQDAPNPGQTSREAFNKALLDNYN